MMEEISDTDDPFLEDFLNMKIAEKQKVLYA